MTAEFLIRRRRPLLTRSEAIVISAFVRYQIVGSDLLSGRQEHNERRKAKLLGPDFDPSLGHRQYPHDRHPDAATPVLMAEITKN